MKTHEFFLLVKINVFYSITIAFITIRTRFFATDFLFITKVH